MARWCRACCRGGWCRALRDLHPHFLGAAHELVGEGEGGHALRGLSSRTLRRLRDQPERALPADLASKAWQLAETLAQASVVFGDAEAAQRWLAGSCNNQR